MGVTSVRTDRPKVGRRVQVGAVEVGHSVVVGVRIACGRGVILGKAGHREKHGRLREGHGGALTWRKDTKKNILEGLRDVWDH